MPPSGETGPGPDAKQRIAATYAAASDHFDELPFWHHIGRRTIERLDLAAGARVIDLCCGTGASALPAAERAGREGGVLGVDLSRELIAIARRNASLQGIGNVAFRLGDIEAFDVAPESFDAVVSVFGLFFVDDMAGVLRRAWRWLKPGGAIAITTWGEHVLEPGESLFWNAVWKEDPALKPVSPANRLASRAAIEVVFRDAGIGAPAIEEESWHMPLTSPEDFWPCILGTSNRGVLEALPPAARERVHVSVIGALRDQHVTSLRLDALYAVARKA